MISPSSLPLPWPCLPLASPRELISTVPQDEPFWCQPWLPAGLCPKAFARAGQREGAESC